MRFAPYLFLCHLQPLLWCGMLTNAAAHGGYHEELQRTDEQIAVTPQDGTLWLHRGYLEFLHGDWQQSLIDLEKADRLAPGKLFTDYVRGQALAAGGRLEAGKTVLDDFIAAHGEHADAYAARARMLLKMNKPGDAAKDFQTAIEKTSHPEPDLYQETAEALIASGQKDAAAKVLQAGIARLGDIPQLVTKALDLEVEMRQFDAALTRVDAMQKAAPRPEPWMAKRATLLAQAGRLEESLQAWIALRNHIAALPNLERGSHAMSVLAEQAAANIAQRPVTPAAPSPADSLSVLPAHNATRAPISITTPPVPITTSTSSR